ncbi:uncharacterized protein LOC126821112 isoform X2 [Patella vulgata]|nr:uncharacterized protein LOC126821112 isoform X2 [Patella vulgata]XP_050405415.1 uncharacterized protein LOC126821112 isoform X2 [Patella vulgata]
MEAQAAYLTLEEMASAKTEIMKSGLVGETPLLSHMQYLFDDVAASGVDLYLKLESMQNTGSFKIRGVVNQISKIIQRNRETKLITMSAGNYGRAFAYFLHQEGLTGLCIMPDSAQQSKVEIIKGYGITVEQVPVSELQPAVDKYVREQGFHFCHSFDDRDLIAGYGSIGMEILDKVPDLDILVICCGGGGLSSGISAAVRAKLGMACRIYTVEPEGSPTMYESFKSNKAVSIPTVKSVASGLSPPYAGKMTFDYCRKFLDKVILVTDAEILDTMKKMFHAGLVVEPSGCAAMAALLSNKIPDVTDKKVAIIVSGGNISVDELKDLMP